jgi:hypothetical protein
MFMSNVGSTENEKSVGRASLVYPGKRKLKMSFKIPRFEFFGSRM